MHRDSHASNEITENAFLRNEKSTCNITSGCSSFRNLRNKTANGLMFGYLNINSMRNKFEFIKPAMQGMVPQLNSSIITSFQMTSNPLLLR